jgi:putative membrane protein
VVNQQTEGPDAVVPPLDGTSMAKLRTQLSLDRTTLAWIRTALTMATFGFGLVAFLRTLQERSPTPQSVHLHEGAIMFGTALVILGIVAPVLAGIAHRLTLRRLHRGQEVLLPPLVFEHYRSNAIGRDRFGVAVAAARTVSGEVAAAVRPHRLGTALQTMSCGALLGIFAGCVGTTDQIVPTGHGTYMIPRHGLMGLSSGSTQKAKAFQDAVAYCRKFGQDIETVLTSETEGGFGGLAAPEIEFRCVPSAPGDSPAPAQH